MSFSESISPAGFNQKTIKGDLFVKGNHGIPPWDEYGKVPEDSRRLSTEAGLDPLTCGAGRPHLEATQPLWAPPVILFVMSILHRLLGCISAVISSRFDPRLRIDALGYIYLPAPPLGHALFDPES